LRGDTGKKSRWKKEKRNEGTETRRGNCNGGAIRETEANFVWLKPCRGKKMKEREERNSSIREN